MYNNVCRKYICWFTDSVTSSNNIIKSGTLDVAMTYADKVGGQYKDASEGAIFDYKLWEPGYTQVKYVKLENLGTLALQYKLTVIPNVVNADDTVKLADVIDVYTALVENGYSAPENFEEAKASMTKVGTLSDVLAATEGCDTGVLLPADGKGSDDVELPVGTEAYTGDVTVCIALHMQESAGNEYQNLSAGDGFSVELLATQFTYENDAFNNQYDEKAEYSKVVNVANQEEFLKALENAKPGTVISGNGLILDLPSQQYDFPAGINIKNVTFNTSSRGGTYIVAKGGSEPLVFEDCTFEHYDSGANIIAINADGPNLEFNNCTFFGPVMPNSVDKADGVLDFNNCTFKITENGFPKTGYVNCMGGTSNFNNCTFDFTGGSTMGSNQYVKWNAVNSFSENYKTAVYLNGCTRVNCGTQKFQTVSGNSTLTVK